MAATTPAAPSTEATATGRWGSAPRRLPWWRIPVYPAAFGIALVLITWDQGFGLHPLLLVRPMAVAVILTIGLTLICSAIVLDRDRGALLACLAILALLTPNDLVLIFVGAVALVIAVEGLIHRGRPTRVARAATRLITIMGVILLLGAGNDAIQTGAASGALASVSTKPLPAPGVARPGLPDVYVFFLDGYPGDRAAARSATFDADAFPEGLTDRGFDVVRDAHSNYLMTPMTVASMLSMRHLAEIPALARPGASPAEEWRHFRETIDDAPAFATFRDHGYAVTAIDAGYAHVSLRRVDRFLDQPEPSEVERAILTNTRLDDLLNAIAPGALASLDRSRIEGSFAKAAAIASEPHGRPRLVFAHVPAPHPPWVFGADGSPRDPASLVLNGEAYLTPEAQLEAGFAQATHVGNLAISAIDKILRDSATPPVIVVMSDHGPMGRFTPDDPTPSDIEMRASSFMAALTPGHPQSLAERPTPVNLFPVLIETYLGTAVDRRPDSIWAWRGDSYLDSYEVAPIEGWAP